MNLLRIDLIQVHQEKILEIDNILRSIYRLIIYSRHHSDEDLLDTYLTGIGTLQELLGIKNAQMESQDEEEAAIYLTHLKRALDFVLQEIVSQRNFEKETQLFHLLRLVSPEASAAHPNRYRHTMVQVGEHLCPEPGKVPALVSQLFFQMGSIPHPIVRAIYFHHELIRIHPFVDGNGRVTRIAKNWMLMYDLYPPIFIRDAANKAEYLEALGQSFKELMHRPDEWNGATGRFFEQELDRLLVNAKMLYQTIDRLGQHREEIGKSPGH